MTHELVLLDFTASSISFLLEICFWSVFQFLVTASGFVKQPLSHTMSCQSIFSGAMAKWQNWQKRYNKSSYLAFMSAETRQIHLIQTLLSRFYQCKCHIYTGSRSLERMYTTF